MFGNLYQTEHKFELNKKIKGKHFFYLNKKIFLFQKVYIIEPIIWKKKESFRKFQKNTYREKFIE